MIKKTLVSLAFLTLITASSVALYELFTGQIGDYLASQNLINSKISLTDRTINPNWRVIDKPEKSTFTLSTRSYSNTQQFKLEQDEKNFVLFTIGPETVRIERKGESLKSSTLLLLNRTQKLEVKLEEEKQTIKFADLDNLQADLAPYDQEWSIEKIQSIVLNRK